MNVALGQASPARSPTSLVLPAVLALGVLAEVLLALAIASSDGGTVILPVLLVAIGAVVVLIRPEIGLVLMFLTVPVETLFWDGPGVRIKPYQAIALVTVAGLVLQVVVHRRTLKGTPLAAPLFLLVLSYIAAFIFHTEFLSLGISLFLLQLWFVVIIYLVSNFADQPELLKRCLWALVIAGALEAAFGIGQAAGFYRAAGPGAAYSTILVEGRPAGTFPEPVFAAAFLSGALLLVLPFWGTSIRRAQQKKAWGVVPYLLLMLLVAAALLTMSRASWLGLLAGLAVYAILKMSERKPSLAASDLVGKFGSFLLGGLLVALVIAWLSPTAFSAMGVRAKNILSPVESENPFETRANEIRDAASAAGSRWLTGHGVGTYGVLTDYGQGVAADREQSRGGVVGSGTPLGLMFDQGIAGLAVYVVLLVVLFHRLLRALRMSVDRTWVPYLQGSLISLVGLTVFALFNNLYYFGFFWLHIALAAAISQAALASARKGETDEASSSSVHGDLAATSADAVALRGGSV